uniref:Uncharacterized protein n=1 Tax=Anopheles culicifacies TaxID=139723 RepID=A0A182LSX2_9DIPT
MCDSLHVVIATKRSAIGKCGGQDLSIVVCCTSKNSLMPEKYHQSGPASLSDMGAFSHASVTVLLLKRILALCISQPANRLWRGLVRATVLGRTQRQTLRYFIIIHIVHPSPSTGSSSNSKASSVPSNGLVPRFISRGHTYRAVVGDTLVLPCEVENLGEYLLL